MAPQKHPPNFGDAGTGGGSGNRWEGSERDCGNKGGGGGNMNEGNNMDNGNDMEGSQNGDNGGPPPHPQFSDSPSSTTNLPTNRVIDDYYIHDIDRYYC